MLLLERLQTVLLFLNVSYFFSFNTRIQIQIMKQISLVDILFKTGLCGVSVQQSCCLFGLKRLQMVLVGLILRVLQRISSNQCYSKLQA